MKYAKGACALTLASMLAACGGGGSSSSGSPGPGQDPDPGNETPVLSAALAGRFLDAPVAGLKYTVAPSELDCEPNDCVTDADGTFNYRAGDTVTFVLGGVTLGSVTAKGVVTPETVAEAVVAANPAATKNTVRDNLLVFLQSLDADGIPDNGIEITPAIASAVEASAQPVDFTAEEGAFDTAMTNLIPEVALATSAPLTVVSREDARDHFTSQLAANIAGTYVWSDAAGNIDPIRTLTLFTSGTYLFGSRENDPGCFVAGAEANGNGIATGTYSYDSTVGTLTFTQAFETTGDCGPDSGVAYPVASFDGNLLSMVEPEDASQFHFVRVPQGNGTVAGAWLFPGPTMNAEPVVMSFFPTTADASSGTFLLADARRSAGRVPGIELGCYTIGENHVMTRIDKNPATCPLAVDTNGDEGLTSDGVDDHAYVDEYGRLIVTDEGVIVEAMMRLTAPATLTYAALGGAWYLESAPGADPEADAQMFVLVVNGETGNYAFGTQHDFEDPNECNAGTYPTSFGTQELHGNGIEAGRLFNLNPVAGVIEPRIDPLQGGLDTNGDCGFYDDWARQAGTPNRFMIRRAAQGNALLAWGNDDDVGIVFRRVQSQANSVVGGWNHFDDSGVKTPEAMVFFPGGQLMSIMYNAASDTSDQGIRRERWLINPGDANSLGFTTDGVEHCVDTLDDGHCEITGTDWWVTLNGDRTVGNYDDDGDLPLEEMRKFTQP